MSRIREIADQFVKVPYRLGSFDPTDGLDCATFILKFFEKYDNFPLDIKIDKSAFNKYAEDPNGDFYQSYIRAYLDLTKYPCDVHPLDILVLKITERVAEHLAIYLGDNLIIHCSNKYGVQLHKLSLITKKIIYVGKFKDGIRHV